MQEGALPARLPVLAACSTVARPMNALPTLVLESTVQFELQACLEKSRSVEVQVSNGERLSAARAVVDLVRAYDMVLDHIRLTPLSIDEQQSMRDRLGPVTQLLRRYRMR
jgi:hypothetical protein